MSFVWMAVLALAAVPGDGGAAGDGLAAGAIQQQGAAAPQSAAELLESVRGALRRWARPEDEHAETAARELLELYNRLGADDRLAPRQREEFRAKIRSRLSKLAAQIGRAVGPGGQTPQRQGVPAADGAAAAAAVDAVMGQVAGRGRPAAARPAPYASDSGEALIDLIQRTIAPETWDVNGGLGTIYYWGPGRALIVRQSYDVHGQVGGAVRQLGRVGR